MRPVTLRVPGDFERAFGRIRDELDVPLSFPAEVETEARQAQPADSDRIDARHLPLVAVDPPGATDLDQAFAAERIGDGHRIFYAIADIASFIQPGGAVDGEARHRGTTLYCPDFRAPLHPTVLSEDRASLLPGGDKPALLWTIELDESGQAIDWRLERALVRVREAISYHQAQDRIDRAAGTDSEPAAGTVDACLVQLAAIGPLRQQLEAVRGGVSLRLPAQEIARQGDHYVLEFDQSLPVEGWNAQISLLAGMLAGQTMFDAGVGVLRTLPPAHDEDLARLRRTAAALGLHWPDGESYADFVRDLRPETAAQNAFLVQCTRLFKGAGYYSFDGHRPDHPEHGAIAAIYSHVTAPLRRLVDRFGNEVVLALCAGSAPPSWALDGLGQLPSLMGQARQRESSLERALLDMTEVLTLEHQVGETFEAVVVDVVERRSKATVQIPEPAVVAEVPADGLSLADQITLRLSAVHVDTRSVSFEPLR